MICHLLQKITMAYTGLYTGCNDNNVDWKILDTFVFQMRSLSKNKFFKLQ